MAACWRLAEPGLHGRQSARHRQDLRGERVRDLCGGERARDSVRDVLVAAAKTSRHVADREVAAVTPRPPPRLFASTLPARWVRHGFRTTSARGLRGPV